MPVELTEGKMCKGGQNPNNTSCRRPPAPKGSGGKIRLWKLGSLEHKLLPSQEAVNKLREIIKQIDWNDNADIIWGPDIEVVELSNDKSIENYTICEVKDDGEFINIKAKRT